MVAGHVLLRPLGSGTHGTVYLAHAVGGTQPVALKLMRLPPGPGQAVARQTFLDAAQVMRALQHPDIVAVHGAGVESDQAWMAMEAVPGTSLSRYTRAPRLLPERLAVQVVQRLAQALAHAHQQGVVHRDVKPANVLVHLPSNSVKLADFGLARLADHSQTATGMMLGSPAYMAPELLAGGVPTPRSDLYALGVTLFELLMGRPLHDGANMGELLRQVMQATPPDIARARPDLPTTLAQLLQQMLAPSPADRPADGASVALQLAAIQQQWPPSLPAPTPN